MKKKLLSALLAVSMLISMAACGSDTSWIATYNEGVKINSGVYLYYGLNSYFKAMSKLAESDEENMNKMFSKGVQVDGKDTAEWIKDDALMGIKEFIAINNKFDELDLKLTDEEIAATKQNSDSFYASNESLLTKNGIGQQSIYMTTEVNYKKQSIFRAYYDVNGIKEVTDSELIKYMNDNKRRVKWIKMELKDGEGNLLKSDGKAKVKKMAEEYIQRANDGESFDLLIDEYNDYYSKLVEEATGEAPEKTDSSNTEDQNYKNESIITVNTSVPSEKVNKAIFEKSEVGKTIFIEDNEAYYVVLRYDISKREDYLEENRGEFLPALKNDEFQSMIDEWSNAAEYTLNEKSFKKYDPKNFDLTSMKQ